MSSLFRPVKWDNLQILSHCQKYFTKLTNRCTVFYLLLLKMCISTDWPRMTSPSLVVQVLLDMSARIKLLHCNTGLNPLKCTKLYWPMILHPQIRYTLIFDIALLCLIYTIRTIYLSAQQSMQDTATGQWTCIHYHLIIAITCMYQPIAQGWRIITKDTCQY